MYILSWRNTIQSSSISNKNKCSPVPLKKKKKALRLVFSVKKQKTIGGTNKNTIFLVTSKSMGEMDLESDKARYILISFVLI